MRQLQSALCIFVQPDRTIRPPLYVRPAFLHISNHPLPPDLHKNYDCATKAVFSAQDSQSLFQLTLFKKAPHIY